VLATVAVYERNADVIAEVLLRANGTCERCGNSAPFLRKSDGSPYLEVHHKVRLADGGDDTVENAIAICPNCHRRAHFG
jgi:5-methylcytosine-specific restriction protein A